MIQDKKLAIIFPGQSSQHIGMLSALSKHFKLIEETFCEVSEILGYDLWQLAQCGPIDKLNSTSYSQPIILTASVAIWRVWKKQGGQIPNIMAGHSLGEYSALVCSNSIDLLSAAKLVRIRGILMQEVSPNGYGSMSVIIGLSADIISELCKIVESSSSKSYIVSPACFNSVGNVVIAGHREAVHQVNLLCKKAGAKYTFLLPISVPSHCALMKSMISKFQKELSKIIVCTPDIPVINNTDVHIEKEPKAICNALIRQLYTPVRWCEIIQNLINKKIEIFLEIGPGEILTKLLRNTADNILSISVNNPDSLLKAMKIFKINN